MVTVPLAGRCVPYHKKARQALTGLVVTSRLMQGTSRTGAICSAMPASTMAAQTGWIRTQPRPLPVRPGRREWGGWPVERGGTLSSLKAADIKLVDGLVDLAYGARYVLDFFSRTFKTFFSERGIDTCPDGSAALQRAP